jgi:Tfp pilus assembly protein PilZ
VTPTTDYSFYFAAGQRVRIDIAQAGHRSFHEWGEVVSLKERHLTVRVALDHLAQGSLVVGGRQLFLRVGVHGKAYRCRGTILAYGDDSLVLTITGDIIHDELREYFRLDTSLPLAYTVCVSTPGWCSGSSPQSLTDSEIVNISGGGFRVRLNEELAEGDQVRISVTLPRPEPEDISLVAQVVYLEPSKTGCCTAGLSFVDIHERQRDSIIRYINNEEMLKKQNRRKPFYSLHDSYPLPSIS